MRLLSTIGILLFLASCTQSKLSDIEVIKFDIKIIDDLMRTSDTIYTERIGHSEAHSAEYFVNRKDGVTSKLLRDSLENVIALTKSKSNKVFFAMEYFSNGQIKGKLPEKTNGEYNGQARYYYENGRVKSEGLFSKGLQSGEWRNYDQDGHLVSIDDFGDGNINPVKTTQVK